MIIPLVLLFQMLATPPDDLTRKISALDAELFGAYNACDLATMNNLVAEDLEFYHDATGLAVGRAALVDAVKNNICGKVHRYLVPGTMAVYPLKGYGAVETGIHMFCDPKSADPTGKCPDGSGVGRFTHLWRNKEDAWTIARAISYDHCNGCSTSIPPDFRAEKMRRDVLPALMKMSEDAWNRGDLATFASFYEDSPETTFMGREITRGGVQAIEERYRKSYGTRERMGTLTFSNIEIRKLAQDVALMTGEFHLRRTAAGGGDADGHYTLIWRKTPSGWKIIHDHSS